MSQNRFKVIIVGGSITGLTLAHSLHQIGVDYIILEKRPRVVLQEGASIGILPNGARILDQLGLYSSIEQTTGSLGASDIYFPDGFHFSSPYPTRVLESFGYPISFMERRRLLEILYNALPDKTKIHTKKEVISVEPDAIEEKSSIRVRTVDGGIYEGDLVVGADGVHSRIRDEMWRMASLSGSPEMTTSGRKTMSAEYSCCFGISAGVAELGPGEQVMRIADGRTLVVIPSRDRVVFWFCTQKLNRRYEHGEIPRFTSKDAEAFCWQLANTPLTKTVCFGDLWEKRQTYNMVAMEEHLLPTWSFGRVVCIGDSIHKMTINFGQGANCAMEDVAAFTNLLYDCLIRRGITKPTDEQLDSLLHRFNTTHFPRVSRLSKASRTVVRLHARDGVIFKMIGRYLVPYLGGKFDAQAFSLIANATALDFLPLRRVAHPGWKKYVYRRMELAPGWSILSSILVWLLILKMILS